MKFGHPSFLIVLILGLGCAAAKSPSEQAARSFMDYYYVRTDLVGAQQYADGLALEKVRTSIQLTSEQAVDSKTRRPKIRYKLAGSEVSGDEADYLFDLTIEPKESDPIQKRTSLKVRKRPDGTWKVTQFADQDLSN